MGKYRKRPVVVEAISVEELLAWLSAGAQPVDMDEWVCEAWGRGEIRVSDRGEVGIATMEGNWLVARPEGYWIIRGVEGEIYPCEGEIFSKTYEAAE